MSRLPIPPLSFADLQLQRQAVHLDPTLQRVADFLEEQTALIVLVRKDLVQSAVKLDLEYGKQLRVDTTVVETNIHYRMSRVKLVYSAGVSPAGQESDAL